MVPSALPKMFLATSSKQSASSIRDAAAAMVVVGALTCALSSPIDQSIARAVFGSRVRPFLIKNTHIKVTSYLCEGRLPKK